MKRRSSAEPPELLESDDSEEIEDPSLLEARADEDAAIELASAEAHRAAGELDLAAQRYRRAAQLFIDTGDDERAVAYSRLASELAALDDALRPPDERRKGRDSHDHLYESQSRIPPWERELVAQGSWPISEAQAMQGFGSGTEDPLAAARRARHAAFDASEVEEVSSSSPAPVLHAVHGLIPPGLEADECSIETLVEEAVADLQYRKQSSSKLASAMPSAPSLRVGPSSALRPSRTPRAFVPSRYFEMERITARLAVLPLFAELESAERSLVARQTGLLRFKRGELLCEAGAPAGPLLMLVEGAACVALPAKPEPVAFVSAGDFVGELAAYFGGPRTATVLAQDDVEALAFSPTLVRSLARRYLSVRTLVEETARDRVRESLAQWSPLLRRLDAAARVEVTARLEYRLVAEGEALFVEGEPSPCLAFVAAGEVELYGGAMGPSRGPYARVGEALGVTSVFLDEPAGLSARAVREALVAVLPAEQARALADRHPRLLDALEDVDTPGRGVAC